MLPDPRDDEELIRALVWLVFIVAIILSGLIGVLIHKF